MLNQHENISKIRTLATVLIIGTGMLTAPVATASEQIITFAPDQHLHSAQQALNAGDHATALEHLRQVETGNLTAEKKTRVFNAIGASNYHLANYSAALDAYTTAIEDDRGYWQAYVGRGNTRRALGDTKGAIADFCFAKQLKPSRVSGNFEAYCEG